MSQIKVVVATKKEIFSHMEELISIERNHFDSQAWEEYHFLSEMPEKFESSILLKGVEGVLGYCMASKKGDNMHIHRFAVSPGLKRNGLGHQMLKEFISRCKAREITLKVDKQNIIAINFYFSQGFLIYSQNDAYFEMKLAIY
jgi:ribosomal protein S18 acetylase RimI-like enzyme